MKTVCEVHPDRPAIGIFTWGFYSEYEQGRNHRRAALCTECCDTLWEGCRGPVTLGLMHYVIERPKTDAEAS